MGRVETRMYKHKRKRARALRLMLLAVLLGIAALLMWKQLPDRFTAERIGTDAPSKANAVSDQRVETREVTLGAETWYAIQTGVFSTREAAEQKADAYTQRGAPGLVVQDGEKWRVFIACYDSEPDAAAVRTRLSSNQKVDTYLYAWNCPEVRLRLTAKAGQLDAVEAGFTLLMSAASALRDTAIDLDAAQLTTDEVREIVTALEGQISLWEDTISSRFGNPLPDLVQQMMTITSGWEQRRKAIFAAEGATALSAELKAQAMGLYEANVAWRNGLLAP